MLFFNQKSAEALISGICAYRISYEKTDSEDYIPSFLQELSKEMTNLGNGWYLFDYENDNRELTEGQLLLGSSLSP